MVILIVWVSVCFHGATVPTSLKVLYSFMFLFILLFIFFLKKKKHGPYKLE